MLGEEGKCLLAAYFPETFKKEFRNLIVNQKLWIKSEHLWKMKHEIILLGHLGWPTL